MSTRTTKTSASEVRFFDQHRTGISIVYLKTSCESRSTFSYNQYQQHVMQSHQCASLCATAPVSAAARAYDRSRSQWRIQGISGTVVRLRRRTRGAKRPKYWRTTLSTVAEIRLSREGVNQALEQAGESTGAPCYAAAIQ